MKRATRCIPPDIGGGERRFWGERLPVQPVPSVFGLRSSLFGLRSPVSAPLFGKSALACAVQEIAHGKADRDITEALQYFTSPAAEKGYVPEFLNSWDAPGVQLRDFPATLSATINQRFSFGP